MKSLGQLVEPLSRLLGSACGPVGLELSAERCNLAQFNDVAGTPELRAVASLPYPVPREQLLADPKALKRFLRQALEQHGFKGRRVVSCLQASELRLFPTSVTVGPGRDEAAALAVNLRERLGAELDSVVVDYLPIRTDDSEPTRRDMLVATAPRERVLAYLESLEGAGLEVCALDAGPAALARLIAQVNRNDARAQHPHALALNFGRHRSHLSVVWGRRLVLDREIEFAEQTVLERISRALDVDESMARQLLLEKGLQPAAEATGADAEIAHTLAEVLRPDFAALVAEINKTLVYTASRNRGRGVDQIYLLGGVGRYPGVGELMQGQLAIPVEVLNPFRAFRSSLAAADLERIRPVAGIALACGLGLRGMHQDA